MRHHDTLARALRTAQRRVACLGLLWLAGCYGLNVHQDFTPVPAATPAVGERWTYRVTNAYNNLDVDRVTQKVMAVSTNRIDVMVTREATRESFVRPYDTAWNPFGGYYPVGLGTRGYWNGIEPGASVNYTPALPLFRFPLVPGARWTDTVTVSNPATGLQVPVKVYSTVEGIERVKVPAGEFDAIKVQRYLYYQDADWWRTGIQQRYADWFAPAVNHVVMHREDSYYLDNTSGGGNGGGGGGAYIYGDYLLSELVEYLPGQR
jgi:hypothetical protein